MAYEWLKQMSIERRQQLESLSFADRAWQLRLWARLDMLCVFHGLNYELVANCGYCKHPFPLMPVLRKFNSDKHHGIPLRCANCGSSSININVIRPELPGLAAGTILPSPQQLNDLVYNEMKRPDNSQLLDPTPSFDILAVLMPELHRAVLFHSGNWREQLQRSGVRTEIEYPWFPVPNWQRKVLPFLGCFKDINIARIAGLSIDVVTYFRTQLRIAVLGRVAVSDLST